MRFAPQPLIHPRVCRQIRTAAEAHGWDRETVAEVTTILVDVGARTDLEAPGGGAQRRLSATDSAEEGCGVRERMGPRAVVFFVFVYGLVGFVLGWVVWGGIDSGLLAAGAFGVGSLLGHLLALEVVPRNPGPAVPGLTTTTAPLSGWPIVRVGRVAPRSAASSTGCPRHPGTDSL